MWQCNSYLTTLPSNLKADYHTFVLPYLRAACGAAKQVKELQAPSGLNRCADGMRGLQEGHLGYIYPCIHATLWEISCWPYLSYLVAMRRVIYGSIDQWQGAKGICIWHVDLFAFELSPGRLYLRILRNDPASTKADQYTNIRSPTFK